MLVQELRTIFLIQAVKESDAKGELLPLAEREEVNREALRGASDIPEAFAAATLLAAGERLLIVRTRQLYERIRLRGRRAALLAILQRATCRGAAALFDGMGLARARLCCSVLCVVLISVPHASRWA